MGFLYFILFGCCCGAFGSAWYSLTEKLLLKRKKEKEKIMEVEEND